MPVLGVRNVWKTYDRVAHVLQDVSFSVEPGEFVVLMGRSGSGKTTLLNLLAGLDRPSRGAVVVKDKDLSTLDDEEITQLRLHHIGIVFQRFHLIPELTTAENIRLPIKMAGRPGARERAAKLLQFFGMDGHGDAFPATLSGGEMQRAALARALANQPAVVLADEPTANLDQANAKKALGELRRVASELGTAVVAASHDAMAAEAATRVLHIVDGRIAATGSIAPTA